MYCRCWWWGHVNILAIELSINGHESGEKRINMLIKSSKRQSDTIHCIYQGGTSTRNFIVNLEWFVFRYETSDIIMPPSIVGLLPLCPLAIWKQKLPRLRNSQQQHHCCCHHHYHGMIFALTSLPTDFIENAAKNAEFSSLSLRLWASLRRVDIRLFCFTSTSNSSTLLVSSTITQAPHWLYRSSYKYDCKNKGLLVAL